jgi:peptide/nickel transport system substrate-binding protein/oligopeptide transport system substrate-binding protein
VDSLQLNWADPPFTDLRARQAFALALDKDTLAKLLGDTPTNHIVPAGSPGYDPGLLGPDETPSTTGDVPLARQLLQSYADDSCHGQFSQCPPVTMYSSSEGYCGGGAAPTTLAYESKAIAMWRQAFPGYPVRGPFTGDANCPLPDLYNQVVTQLYSASGIADYADAQDWLSLQFGLQALFNPNTVDVPAAATLLAQADQTLDPTERTALYNQAEQLLVFNVAWIPIGQNLAYFNVRSSASGFALTELGYPSLDQWYGFQMMTK